jgi:ATP-binding cassette, subfamily B, bacterial
MFKIPKIDHNSKKPSAIVYPKVTNWDIIKIYLKLMKPRKFGVMIVAFGVTLASIAEYITIPIFYKRFFDLLQIISEQAVKNIEPLFIIIFAVLFLNMAKWVGWRLSWYATSYVESHVIVDGAQEVFEYLIKHSHSFFANNFTGSLTQRITRFSRAFIPIFDRVFFDLFPLIIKVVGAGVVLYLSRPVIAYAIWVWIALFLAVSFTFTRMKLKYDIEAAATASKISGMFADSISNHNSVQAFSAYDEEARRIKGVQKYFQELTLFRWSFTQTINAVQSLLSIAIEFFIFYFGIKYWQAGQITLGTFVMVQAYVISIGGSLWNFSRIVRDIYEGFADAKETVEMVKLPHEIKDVPNAKPLNVQEGRIEFKNLGFKFGKAGEGKNVFENMNITIEPGQKVALIGSSGAGKSTLVKLLLRLHDIEQGEILVDGQNIKEVTQESLRNNISLVPQDPVLFHRTLLDNIRYGRREATDEEVMNAAKLAHCDIFISEFPQKYETYVGERGVKLSGGERQRVAIARAILKNAPILVLDEATSSLDSHSESLIQDALHTLMKGKTTIVIAHRLSTIRNMDRIIVVSKGGVVEDGSHDELLKKKNGVYAKLWSLQAGGFANKSIEELLEV